jgi:hypothetical protein
MRHYSSFGAAILIPPKTEYPQISAENSNGSPIHPAMGSTHRSPPWIDKNNPYLGSSEREQGGRKSA